MYTTGDNYISVKLHNIKDKEKIFKAAREKYGTYKETEFAVATVKTRRWWNNLKVLRDYQLELSLQTKLTFKNVVTHI